MSLKRTRPAAFVSRRTRGVFLALAFAASSCGPAPRPETVAPVERAAAPDVHGEPLALLPASPLAWLRVDMHRVRASQHWDTAFPLLAQRARESLATIERELGFDPLRAADMFALGLYPQPGAHAGDGTHAWPVFYARGDIHRDAIEAAARARARPEDPLNERHFEGVTYLATRERAYLFPADDVVIVCDAALSHRVIRRLLGRIAGSVASENRFDSLWSQTDGRDGTIQFAGDVAALRAAGAPIDDMASAAAAEGGAGASRLDLAVGRLDMDASLQVRIAATASSEDAARRIVLDIDHVRAALLRRWDVRLLGMTRLLMQGFTDVNEGRTLRIRVDAEPGEVGRVLRVAQLGG